MAISGIADYPKIKPAPAVILMHGYTGDKDEHGRFVEAGKRLAAKGFVAIRFDFRYGKTPENKSESDGQLSDMTPEEWVSDAKVVLSYAAGLPEVDAERIGVVGLSMGGYTAICSAARSKLAKAVVAWSAPAVLRPTRRWIRGKEHLERFKRACEAFVPLLDCKRIAPRPFLVVAGTEDSVVDFRNAVKLFKSARVPKSLYLVGGADHVFSNHQGELLGVTEGWLASKLASREKG
ncbi:MAG: dienelactone hydrolase family protein [Candidatus Brockarchaeota archaeon]|nr:dienelactone hydrolase family protein [Candidatus Brockarchaeota archaeon]